jgi:beta-lactamase superfamily II metal-dependent hydrolase
MAANRLVLLDMGREKFGDSIFCQFGSKTILIDGGHPGDDAPSDSHASIPDQIRALAGQWPLKVDLLVITHCHRDHIGCLPALVDQGLTATWVLAADPDLGWGKIGNIPDAVDALHPWDAADPVSPIDAAVTALFDDRPFAKMSRAERDAAIADLIGLEDKYRGMLTTLKTKGAKVVRYGVNSHTQLVKAFATCGMKILGPTKAHVKACAEYLAEVGRDAVETLANMDASDPRVLLDGLLSHPRFALDGGQAGAALNNQSIILRFVVNNRRLLLPGDMQFAKPAIKTVIPLIPALRKIIKTDGPYDFVKTAHHTSDNGLNTDLLGEWGSKTIFAHSGGLNDPTHPDPEALADLKALHRAKSFARTDRNGQITLDLDAATLKLKPDHGTLNNFQRNPDALPISETISETAVSTGGKPPTIQIERSSENDVTVVAHIPRQRTRVILTIEVEPLEGNAGGTDARISDSVSVNIGGGRKLKRLLFATSERALTANLGAATVRAVIGAVPAAGGKIITDLDPQQGVQACAAKVHAALKAEHFDGLVLLGGYDVVPSVRLDVLTRELRAAVEDAVPDPDEFIVWADGVYSDTNHDTYGELPVSRVPDARSREVFINALQAGPGSDSGKLCVYNAKRPFAKTVFGGIAGKGSALSSVPATQNEARGRQSEMLGNLYLMLHGDSADGTTFWGEDTRTRRLVEAFDTSCVPARGSGVVFSGACWGALTVTRRAAAQDPSRLPQPKTVENSIALAALRAGYRAFIGCTGAHYSPMTARPDMAGGPMHVHFWRSLATDKFPALALFNAKRAFEANFPRSDDAGDDAINQKILRQFTCLGLGW